MHAVSALLLLLLPLVFGQDENLPQGPCDLTTDECVEVIDGSACYNSAIQAGNLTALMSCYPGGEKQVCSCYGCDRSMINYITANKLCGVTG